MAIYFCRGDEDCFCCLFETYTLNRADIYGTEVFEQCNNETNVKFQIDANLVGDATSLCGTQFDSATLKLFCQRFGIKILAYENSFYILDRKLIKDCRSVR